jgi:hypothetical protein
MRKRWLVAALFSLLIPVFSDATCLNDQTSQRALKPSDLKQKRAARLKVLQQQLPRLEASALAITNPELKIETLGRLADLLWVYDSPGARQLFQKTYDLLRSIEPADERAKAKSEGGTSKLPCSKLIGLYVRFFSQVARHDSAWSKQLLEHAPEFITTPAVSRNLDLNTANLLLGEKDPKAFDFIAAGISSPASGLANTMQILDLLMRLRRLDAKKADQLFLQAMRQLESQTITLTDDLLTVGNYLFTGQPLGNASDERIIISPVFVGRVAFHADISYDRPGNSLEIVDAYLRTSAAILTRPTDSEEILSQNRAAAFLLLPKARRFAPDLVPVLTNLSNGIDPARTNSAEARVSAITADASASETVESVMESLDRIQDVIKRDEYCLRKIWSFYMASDFKSAARLTSRMASSEILEQLSFLISVGQATDSLQKNALDSARLQTERLPASKERSFLWFAIGNRLIENGDQQGGRVAINNGVADARKTEGSVRASLLLLGTELISSFDSVGGLSLFSETLIVINHLDVASDEPLRFERFVRVRVGAQSATFSTDISGAKSGTLRGALKIPVSYDPNGAFTLILQFKNEYIRSSALIAFVTELTS